MFNPYVILGQIIGLILAIVGAYHYGYNRAEDAAAARVATAQDKAITDANAATEAATKLAVEQAKAEAVQRLAATTIRLKGERDAALKARPDCVRDTDSMRLLQSALDSANGQSTAIDSVPDPVPTTPTAGER